MRIEFEDLVIEDDEREMEWCYSIEWIDSCGSVAISEIKDGILYMPHDAPSEVVQHEAHHILFDYLRKVNNAIGEWPYDYIKFRPRPIDEEFVIAMWTLIVNKLCDVMNNARLTT